jgi:hypothetical protein
MDLYALMVVRGNSYKTTVDRARFDDIFRKFCGQDSSLEVRITFDVLGNKSILPVNVLSILLRCSPLKSVKRDDIYDLYSVAACILAKKFCCSPLFRERLNWQSHVNHLLKEGSFCSMYRMQYGSFCELVRLLPFLMVSVRSLSARIQYHTGTEIPTWHRDYMKYEGLTTALYQKQRQAVTFHY